MPKKILVVEDEENIRDLIQSGLKAKGFEVIATGDGLKGLNLARKERPDLIILDVMLPKMDGYHICRMLKFDKHYGSIPIILVTARGQQSDKEIADDIKADAYVLKPFEWKELLEVVHKLLDLS